MLGTAIVAAVLTHGCLGRRRAPSRRRSPRHRRRRWPRSDDLGPPLLQPSGQPHDVVTGLASPWSIAFLGETAFVSQRETGIIVEVLSDGSVRDVGTVDDLAESGESGLLGLAIDARRPTSTPMHRDRTVIASCGSRSTALPARTHSANRRRSWTACRSRATTTAGASRSVPTGCSTPASATRVEGDSAQDVGVLSGKILRMTPDGDVPDDNPFAGSLVYSLGHRNSQGLDWAADGTMFASEFGQDTWDELNIIVAGGNYGWPIVEGIGDEAGFIDPVQQWRPAQASPSGLTVIDDTVFIANLRGAGPARRAGRRADPVGHLLRRRVRSTPGRHRRARRDALVPDQQHRRPWRTAAQATTASSAWCSRRRRSNDLGSTLHRS